MNFCSVAIAKQKVPILTYRIPESIDLKVGQIVAVPFRNTEATGIVWEIIDESKAKSNFNINKIKFIVSKLDIEPIINKGFKEFIIQASSYFLLDIGSVIKMVLPTALNTKIINKNLLSNFKVEVYEDCKDFKLPDLSEEQQNAYNQICASKLPVLLKGVTGSGKTEVYFHKIYETIKKGEQVILMLPEIGLATQIISRFKKSFGFSPAVWHSGISPSYKKKTIADILSGKTLVTIGTRSCLFLPYKNLGLIIVDEEQDGSYKQEESILYNARDSAVLRGFYQKIPVILVSATPSLETYQNVIANKYQMVEIQSRFGKAVMPRMNIVDMKLHKSNQWLSPELIIAMKNALAEGRQSLLFLNRRGYAPLMLCASCGYRFSCKNCSSWLVMHKKNSSLSCHHCGHNQFVPSSCPSCLCDNLVAVGPGVERIEDEVKKIFPEARIIVITKDSFTEEADYIDIISKIENGEVDIIIGTQIITKGYHFPLLTVVGIIDADLGLSNIDLKASERSFQLLQQVSGRAGRDEFAGEVFIQTFNPENEVILALQKNDLEKFYNAELARRKLDNLPPFSRMSAILITGDLEAEVISFAKNILTLAPKVKDVSLFGPAPATLSKLRGNFRYRILVNAPKILNIQKYILEWQSKIKLSGKVNLKVEIDPYSFY